MILTHYDNQLTIPFKENEVVELVIENPHVFSEFVGDMLKQTQGQSGEIILSEKEKPLNWKKDVQMVVDFISLDLNGRTVINALFKQMMILGSEIDNKKQFFSAMGIEMIDEIIQGMQYDNITYNLDVGWGDIFKAFSVRVDDEYETLAEKVVMYLRLCSELLHVKLVCFVNIKSYLTERDLIEVYKMAGYFKFFLLFD